MNKQLSQILVFSLSLVVSVTLVPRVSADDSSVAVTDNGAKSDNSASVNNSSQTNIQQNNDATIHNNITSTSNTGGNSTNFNTGGENKIVTGDVKNVTEVKNTANTSTVDTGDCHCNNSSSSTTVSGNGAGSENNVSSTNSNKTNVSVNNNATVTNNVKTYANTGNNSSDFNTGGDSIIKTGDIRAVTVIDNGPINTAKVKVQGGGSNALSSYLKIAGNGAFSENNIYEKNKNYTNINVNNMAQVYNNVDNYLNTGKNSADFNTGGDSLIITGNIDAITLINNAVNFSLVEVVCGCEKKPHKPLTPHEEIPKQPSAPTPPTTSVGGPGPGPSAPGPGAPTPTTLPVTGNNALFFFMLANIMTLLLGTYLRLRSGRSPGNLV